MLCIDSTSSIFPEIGQYVDDWAHTTVLVRVNTVWWGSVGLLGQVGLGLG